MAKMKYRDNTYFNSVDYYFIETPFGYLVSRLSDSNNYWYSIEQLHYKMTSVRCINCNELVGNVVKHKHSGLIGFVNKFVSNAIGVYWLENQNMKDAHISYWNDPSNLMFLHYNKSYVIPKGVEWEHTTNHGHTLIHPNDYVKRWIR